MAGTRWPSKAGSEPPTAPSPEVRAAKSYVGTGSAPPFWALTVESDEATPTGYGVNTHAVLIRYARRVIPLTGEIDGFSSVRTEFGPGCRELLRRAGGAIPVFVCEAIPPRDAEQVARAYLIDAAMSQAQGRGPLVTHSRGWRVPQFRQN